jgi:ADP-heptose:LPS heptosyltransferase
VRALVVRFSAIGDCAMAAHAASCIRRSHRDGVLVWAVEERCAAIVDEKELVTEKAVYPREKWKRGAWTPRIWSEQLRYYAKLRKWRFDIGLDLQGHSKTAICLRLSAAKRRLAVRATDPLARRLNPVLQDFCGRRHTVERQLYALRTLGPFPGDSQPIMPQFEPGLDETAVIAVGAGQPWKAYPLEQWREVARGLLDEGIAVEFIGGPGEPEPEVEGAKSFVGRLDLRETMKKIARSRLVLAADTGAGHIAAGYGVPVVSIFGPTDPEEFRPYTNRGIVLKKGANTSDVASTEVVEAALKLWRAYGEQVSH